MIAEFWVKWSDVRVMMPFAAADSTRPIIEGVLVEFTPTKEPEWRARMVSLDGRRLAVLDCLLTTEQAWPYGHPTSFVIPLDLIKRVKKAGCDTVPVKLLVEYGPEDLPPVPEKRDDETFDEIEARLAAELRVAAIIARRVTVEAVHDPVRCSAKIPEGVYPQWRMAVPEEPYVPCTDVKICTVQAADFGDAVAALGGGRGIGFFRSRDYEPPEDRPDASGPLIVRSNCTRFFGVLSPMHLDWDGDQEMQLPLWLGDNT